MPCCSLLPLWQRRRALRAPGAGPVLLSHLRRYWTGLSSLCASACFWRGRHRHRQVAARGSRAPRHVGKNKHKWEHTRTRANSSFSSYFFQWLAESLFLCVFFFGGVGREEGKFTCEKNKQKKTEVEIKTGEICIHARRYNLLDVCVFK